MYGQRYWVSNKKIVELTLNSQAAWVTLRSSYDLIGEKGEVQHVMLVTSLLETNCNLCDPFKYVKIEMKRLRWQDGDAVDGFGHFNHQNPLFCLNWCRAITFKGCRYKLGSFSSSCLRWPVCWWKTFTSKIALNVTERTLPKYYI